MRISQICRYTTDYYYLIGGIVLLTFGFGIYVFRELDIPLNNSLLQTLKESSPSFFHTCAFSLITFHFARHLGLNPISICLFWITTNNLFELLQIEGGLLNGYYDINDIISSILGGFFSYMLIKIKSL